MTVFAHGGEMHWYESIIYLVPIVGFGAWLAVTTIKDRREQRRERNDANGAEQNGAMNRAERRAAARDARKRDKEKRS